MYHVVPAFDKRNWMFFLNDSSIGTSRDNDTPFAPIELLCVNSSVYSTPTRAIIVHETMYAAFEMMCKAANKQHDLTLCIIVGENKSRYHGSNDRNPDVQFNKDYYKLCTGFFLGTFESQNKAKHKLVTVHPDSYIFRSHCPGSDTLVSWKSEYKGGLLDEVHYPRNGKYKLSALFAAYPYKSIITYDEMVNSHIVIDTISYSARNKMYSYFYGSFDTLSALAGTDFVNAKNDMKCIFFKGDDDVTTHVDRYLRNSDMWYTDDPTFDFFWDML